MTERSLVILRNVSLGALLVSGLLALDYYGLVIAVARLFGFFL